MELFDQIPGYREAVERESNVRDASFLDLPVKICGVEIQAMTPRHFLFLDGIGSPFIGPGKPSPEHVALFLWVMSPRFKAGGKIRRHFFFRSIRRLNFAESCIAIDSYIADTFQDSPGGRENNGVPFFSSIAALVDNIATEYGWTEAAILHCPFKRLFQYLKIIRKKHDPKAILFNPSDRVRGKYLEELNRKWGGA